MIPSDSAWQPEGVSGSRRPMVKTPLSAVDAARLNLDVLLGFSETSLMALQRGMPSADVARIALDLATDILETANIGDVQARREWLINEIQTRMAGQ